MADVFTKAKRSEVMSRIRGSGNKDTEIALIRIFRESHIRGWRRNRPLTGRPDFVFPALRLAAFVDGCFWHSCPRHCRLPGDNAAFWRRKLESNRKRDRVVNRALRREGWRVLRIWEHELKAKNRSRLLARLLRVLHPTV